MNPRGHNTESAGRDAGPYEATLHVLAHAPVPEGLEERVRAALSATPRRARILEWPGTGGWMRAAAAAAIMFVVAGGGWGVYRHAQNQAARAVVTPAPQTAPAAGGFSSAGAMRTPQTVQGPAVVEKPKSKANKKQKTTKPAAVADQPATVGAGR